MSTLIYHIAAAIEWDRACRDGEYRLSTRERTLDGEGFIHASRAHQVAQVANALYAGVAGLVLLVIDEDRLTPEVRYEGVPELFPHIYGPLNIDAVVEVRPFAAGPDGRFTFSA